MHAYLFRLLVFSTLIFILVPIRAQYSKYQFNNEPVITDSNKLNLNFQSSAFLKNNEYFNKITEGYTLMGFWATPALAWHPSENSVIEGGLSVLKFNGRDNFFLVQPVFSFTQKITNSFSIVLGTLKYNNNHLMSAPILNPERFYFNQADNGLQLIIDGKSARSDIWFSVDSFIWYGDTVQEQFSGGASNEFILSKSDGWALSLPLQLIVTHKGGQINTPEVYKPIETLINAGAGLTLEISPETWLQKIRINPHFFLYNRNTSAKTRPFKNGWAIYPNIYAESKPFYFNLAYWHAESFIAPMGEAIYQSISTVIPENLYVTRNLFTGKMVYGKLFPGGIQCYAGFEGYYNTDEKLFDYNFYFHFVFNGKFKLKI